ncbi:MAG: precorrin-6Y C5,15-methyltransferase (decarboxylating) subunit CbiT [Methanobrevibacter sp.]|nr:precorrin-6Y C5,15-methyltransferase (decarboxylating) subunit CbiT [Methanobrevibacter sp.]
MIKDEDFISSQEVPGPSKEEIRCLVLCKSQVSANDLVVDIGCGTGGITTEMAKRAKKVIAIDKNSKAIDLTKQNIKKHNVDEKVDLIKNDGISALKSIESMDIAIIGGSGSKDELDEILELAISKLNPNGRIVITAILINTKLDAVEKLKQKNLNPEIIEVNVSRGHILQRGIMMKAENPISIIYGKI